MTVGFKLDTLMKTPNPYDFTGAVDDRTKFAGRQHELAQIMGELPKFEVISRTPESL